MDVSVGKDSPLSRPAGDERSKGPAAAEGPPTSGDNPRPVTHTRSGLSGPVLSRGAPSRLPDRIYRTVLWWLAFSVIAALLLVTVQLAVLCGPSLKQFGISFLGKTDWDPTSDLFGALPFLVGTLVTALEAMLLAVPLGLGTAIFLSEMSDGRLKRWVRFPIEMLAAVPSVVYGLWGLGQLAPLLREYVEPALRATKLSIFAGPALGVGILAAGLVLAVMVFPTVVSLSLEVFQAVPHDQREAFYALGATRWEMIRRGLLPYSRTGLFGACLLALGRALGETMAVAMVIGNNPDLVRSLLGTGSTLASVIANEFTEAVGDLHRAALAELGLVLLGMTLLIAVVARLLVQGMGRSFKVKV
jgi:phosphate transport system permease protein